MKNEERGIILGTGKSERAKKGSKKSVPSVGSLFEIVEGAVQMTYMSWTRLVNEAR